MLKSASLLIGRCSDLTNHFNDNVHIHLYTWYEKRYWCWLLTLKIRIRLHGVDKGIIWVFWLIAICLYFDNIVTKEKDLGTSHVQHTNTTLYGSWKFFPCDELANRLGRTKPEECKWNEAVTSATNFFNCAKWGF